MNALRILIVISLAIVILYVIHRGFASIGLDSSDFSFESYSVPSNDKLRIPESEKHDKWIVITSVNYPTADVKKLAAIPGWKMVMVGDTKSPKDWSYPNVVFLDVKAQESLGFKSTKLLKYKSYTRKNIGYLYAIQHGAKVIYETDDDNSPSNGKIEFDQTSRREYLVYDSVKTHVVNPYAHFGQSTIWPRGYPLDHIGDPIPRSYRKCKNPKATIQQGVVDGDPDVDAIFRLTRKDAGVDLKVQFDKTASPVLLPKGVIAPYNTQNTLHLYDAFWGLLIPQTVAFRVCDIWRGYWAQRLMWDINSYITFFPPNAVQYRNSHSYLDDFIDERELYHLSSSLVEYLVNWKSNKAHFFDRVLQLSQDMAEKDFWRPDDALLVRYWLEDLIAIGYQPPLLDLDGNGSCDGPKVNASPVEQQTSYLGLNAKLKMIL